MSVWRDCRDVSKEGVHGCQLGGIAGMSIRRDRRDVSKERLQGCLRKEQLQECQ